MNPCPQCGAIPQPSDKFCNICGTPCGPPGFGAQPGGFPPPQAGGFGAPPAAAYGAPPGGQAPLRCQMGHDIAPGASYCPHGHPIALDAMPFANDQYGGGGYQQQGGFGAPPPQQGGFGAPPPQQGGFGAPPPAPGYGSDPGGGYGAPQGGGFGAQPQYGQQPFQDPNAGQYGGGGYGQQPGGFGGAPPAPPAQQGGFGAPPAQQPGGFGGQPGGFPQQGGFGGAAPEAAAAPAAPVNLPPNALRGFLVSYQSNTQGDFWPLHGGRKTVGRANSGEQVDIPLSDATISSRHAAIIVDAGAGTIQVEDTGSTNGTFVNEEHIGFNGKRDLRDGDKVRFGGFSTVIKVVGRI
ncbi:MAG: FHA domain-containing protein [Labilithrix sp.]|nr:FHA domain-containing protein [Labilithrix sp.]